MEVKLFVPPNQRREWAYWSDFEKAGKAIFIPLLEDCSGPSNASAVRELFKGSDYVATDYREVESVISFLNQEVMDGQNREPFEIPLNNRVEYILKFNEKVMAYLHGVDEGCGEDKDCCGEDDTEMLFCLRGILLLDENIPDQELMEIAQWLQRAFAFS
jgi:hypothetical protein